MTWRLKRTAQCKACPWKVSTDPHEIPNGYSVEKHCALRETIADESGPEEMLKGIYGPLRIMACHEEHAAHCIGWLAHQLGPGNNIALRISMLSCENAHRIRTFGEQHETFEDTLPPEARDELR